MKELNQPIKDKVNIVDQRQVEKQTLVGTLRPKPGHKCYQLDLSTKEITEAEYREVNVELTKETVSILPGVEVINRKTDKKIGVTLNAGVKKELVVKPNCLYTVALNPKNADKKFHGMLGLPYLQPVPTPDQRAEKARKKRERGHH